MYDMHHYWSGNVESIKWQGARKIKVTCDQFWITHKQNVAIILLSFIEQSTYETCLNELHVCDVWHPLIDNNLLLKQMSAQDNNSDWKTSTNCFILAGVCGFKFTLQCIQNYSGIPIFNLQGKQKLIWKVGKVGKSGVNSQYSTEWREMIFGSSYQKVWKIQGSWNWDSTVLQV